MENLAQQKCVPCESNTPPLSAEEVKAVMQTFPLWSVKNNSRIEKTVETKDFISSLKLANQIGQLAEDEGHHPDLEISWGKLKISLETHAIGGLSKNDFVMAAKIDLIT